MKYETKKDKAQLQADYNAVTKFVKANETNNTVLDRTLEDKKVKSHLFIIDNQLKRHDIFYHYTKHTNWDKLKELVYDEELRKFIYS